MADAMNATPQSMECPVCISIYTDPKILSCSHTICKTCLDKLLGCHGNCQIRCPFCRAVTQVPNEDVGKLQSNLALMNMIEDMKCHQEPVLICGYNGKPSDLVYLQSCGKYVCTTCLRAPLEDFSGHGVRTISKISRRYCKCRKHPEEDEKCFCSSCRRFICLRCVDIEHKDEGHQVIEATAYESRHMKSIEDLKSKVDKKRSCLQKYIDFIDKQMKSVDNAKKQCTSDINKAYKEAVRQLTEKRDSLLREVDDRTEGVEKEMECMKTTAKKQINQLTTIAEMVTKRTKIPFDMDTLAAHDTLCEELREIIDQKNPDYEQPRKLRNKGKSVSFERSIGGDELCLGKIVNEVKRKMAFSAYKVLRVSNFALPSKDSMNTMVNTPDGRIALGCHTGGVNIFSAGGMLQQTVLKDRKVRGIGFLSDRHCVVIDTSNSITLYTPY
ncbi:tripartite motif-containing protein 2-like [Lytechinus variegatus]|uniref:tripartite motif-containing protein 2-like n=1 Tax=Lytechinus variegatus TaxID=7654 RepID=UPI001BB1589A|nr:tripartite motif-containing protein 2-like [Lytechinus variegatus]